MIGGGGGGGEHESASIMCRKQFFLVGVGSGHPVFNGSIIIIDTTDYVIHYFQGCDHILSRIYN